MTSDLELDKKDIVPELETETWIKQTVVLTSYQIYLSWVIF